MLRSVCSKSDELRVLQFELDLDISIWIPKIEKNLPSKPILQIADGSI
jgi:hypothetical protein